MYKRLREARIARETAKKKQYKAHLKQVKHKLQSEIMQSIIRGNKEDY